MARRADVKAERGTFAVLNRRWRKGDTVALRLPFPSRTVAIEERAPDLVAAMRGPVMLAAVDPPDELAASGRALSRDGCRSRRGAGVRLHHRGRQGADAAVLPGAARNVTAPISGGPAHNPKQQNRGSDVCN